MTAASICIIAFAIAVLSTAGVVVNAETFVISDWVLPYNGPQTIDAKVGDTIEFNWVGFHNVNIHPTNACSMDGSINIGNASPASYTFMEEDGSPGGTELFFACDVGRHCANGQNLIVTVKSALVNQEAPPINTGPGLSSDTCSRNLPTSSGMAATKCALPPDQVCCYGVQLQRATKCTCTGNINGNGPNTTYLCVSATADDCPDNQNPNIITSRPAPSSSLRPTTAPTTPPATTPPPVVVVEEEVPPPPPVEEVEECSGATCDPADADSCNCRPSLTCRNRGPASGFICSQVSRVGRTRLSNADGVGGAGGRSDRGQ